jgi:hypothetical protein
MLAAKIAKAIPLTPLGLMCDYFCISTVTIDEIFAVLFSAGLAKTGLAINGIM